MVAGLSATMLLAMRDQRIQVFQEKGFQSTTRPTSARGNAAYFMFPENT